jgi:hypothetical protein
MATLHRTGQTDAFHDRRNGRVITVRMIDGKATLRSIMAAQVMASGMEDQVTGGYGGPGYGGGCGYGGLGITFGFGGGGYNRW